MKAEIISIGTELLLGHSDTNSSYLAREFSKYGLDLYWISQVGDNLPRIVDAFERAASRSNLIVTSGGLGPTEDDLTRNAIATWSGEKLEIHQETGEKLRASYLARGRPLPMPESRLKMALKIPSATLLANPDGAAPGWLVEARGVSLIALPGIPVELMGIWEQEAVPRLRARGLFSHIILSRTVKTVGIGESDVEERIRDLIHCTNPTVATYATRAGVQIRITAKAEGKTVAESLIEPLAHKIEILMGEHFYGVDDETLSQAIGEKLITQSITLAAAESGFTGGALVAELTAEQRSMSYFKGGVVLVGSGNPVEIEVDGAESADGALEVARRACAKFSADIALALTGSLDAKNSVPEKITELCFGISGVKGERSGHAHVRVTTVVDTRRRAVLDGMGELWRYLSTK